MAPLMFTFNRSTQTMEEYQISVKTNEETNKQETCAMKYSFYAQSQGNTTTSVLRKISNCTKVENVYLRGKLIGRKYCVPFR
jgi:hypothetical protein